MDDVQKKALTEKFKQHIENAFDVLTQFDNEWLDYELILDDWTDIALSMLFVRQKIIQMIQMHGKLDIPEELQLERAHLFQKELGKLVTDYTWVDPREQARKLKEVTP